MLVYGLKVYLMDGYWGYVRIDGCGGFELTKDEGTILCFQTKAEAREFYFENVKNATCNGVAVDTSKVYIVDVQY